MKEGQNFRFKIAVIGDSQVGKTSLMEKFTKISFDKNYGKTFGVRVSMFESESEGNIIRLLFWDIANNPLWLHYLGLCFHYITDWGTSYHSPVSIAKKVVPYSILGGICMGLFKTLINWINNNGKIQEGGFKLEFTWSGSYRCNFFSITVY
ncbi:MAG: hypothetical protein KJI71_05070 [Patescibacteria group bacterium]|nr:hypothetical protein [Patescibacteria group bacterium]